MANSIIILTNKEQLTYTGEKHKGDGYYGYSDGLHTVSFHVSNFIGRIYLQATLVEVPTEDDWFDIANTTFTADSSTVTSSYNFTGNYVWVRSKTQSLTAGTTNSILLNH